jgi:predicted acetyltransferase
MHLKFLETSGPLPTSTYEVIDGEKSIGKFQLRHNPSKSEEFPEGFESHIYYEIYPEYRDKGYGTKTLALGLEEARKIGLREVMLTCTEENTASQKIIVSNGGELLKKAESRDGEQILKYKIILSVRALSD